MAKILVFHPEGKTNYLCGEVIAFKYIGKFNNEYPNFLLRVRGRSGKTLDVDFIKQNATPFDTWKEGVAKTNLWNKNLT